jgi:flagellar biosynthetic protein FliQ
MLEQSIIDIIAQAIMTVIYVAMPPLLVGLTVGLFVAIFQAVTSIQEQTLAFIPKIIAVFAALMFFGPFMITLLRNFLNSAYELIPYLTTI